MNFRICLLSCFFVVPFCLPGIVQAQGGGDFSSWFGGTLLGPTSTDLDLVIDGFWIGDEFELIGSEGGRRPVSATPSAEIPIRLPCSIHLILQLDQVATQRASCGMQSKHRLAFCTLGKVLDCSI